MSSTKCSGKLASRRRCAGVLTDLGTCHDWPEANPAVAPSATSKPANAPSKAYAAASQKSTKSWTNGLPRNWQSMVICCARRKRDRGSVSTVSQNDPMRPVMRRSYVRIDDNTP